VSRLGGYEDVASFIAASRRCAIPRKKEEPVTEVWRTIMGRKLIEGTIPEIARNLGRIADALERQEQPAEVPRCAWCDHRHHPLRVGNCLAHDCECQM